MFNKKYDRRLSTNQNAMFTIDKNKKKNVILFIRKKSETRERKTTYQNVHTNFWHFDYLCRVREKKDKPDKAK